MARFFISASNMFGGIAYLTSAERDHIKVLRLRQGETFTVCDGSGNDYTCRLDKTEEGDLCGRIIKTEPSVGEPTVNVAVFAALAKGDKNETVIQKCVELGAREINIFPSARCVSRINGQAAAAKKTERWQKISLEAAKQSGRALVPEVHDVVSFDEALQMAGELDKCIIPYEKAEGMESSRKAVYGIRECGSAGIFIGPEGGFDTSEVEKAVRAGAVPVTLGHRILRTETAGAAVMSVIMFASDRD